jgi:hypothetical protein
MALARHGGGRGPEILSPAVVLVMIVANVDCVDEIMEEMAR